MTSAERAEEVFTHFTERLEALEGIVAANATAFEARAGNLDARLGSLELAPKGPATPAPGPPTFAASLRYANKPCADCGTHLRAGVPGYFQRAIQGVQKSAIYCTPCGGARGGA